MSNITSYKSIAVLFFYLLFDLIAFASVLPLLPNLVKSFSLNESDRLYNSMNNITGKFRQFLNAPDNVKWNIVLFGGLLGSSFSICQFLCSPIICSLSDVLGRKPMLLFTSIGMLISYWLWAISGNSFTVFFVSRIIGGICKANIGISIAVIGDIYGETKRSSGMAIIGIAFSLGFIIGPILGVIVGSYQNVAILSTLITLFNIIFIGILFNETLPTEKRSLNVLSKVADAYHLVNPISIFLYRPMHNLKFRDLTNARQLGFVYFMYLFIYSGLEFTLTFLTHLRFDYTSAQQGRLYCFIGIIMILVQGGLVRRLKAGREKLMALMGMFALVLGFCLLGLSHTLSVFYLGLVLFAFASGCVVSCVTVLVSQCDNPDAPQQGRMMGLLRSQGCLARGLGPLCASVLYWLCGAEITYMIGSILMFFPIIVLANISTKMYY